MNEAWSWRPIGELFEIGAGKTMSAAARDGKSKMPFLRTSNVLWDQIDLSTVDEMAIPQRELPGRLLRPGDLVVCEGGEIGRAALWDGQIPIMAFQNHLHRLRPTSDAVEPRFYVYFLQCAFTQLGIFEGAGNKTTIPNLSRNRLASLVVPHPPLDVQSAIASVLGRIREAIVIQRRVGALAEELKRAAMRELFTRGLRGEAQKETDIGPVPESWRRVPISALGTIVTGNTPPTSDRANYQNGEVPFIAPGDIEHGAHIAFAYKHITPQGLSFCRPIPAGATCFVCIGSSIGKVGLTTAQLCATNQQINAILPLPGFPSDFVFYLMSYWADHVRKHASPSPVPILSKGAFERVAIYTSSNAAEQREIGIILSTIDRKIDLHKRKKRVLEELFKALLHKLMTGEIRVADLDLAALEPGRAAEAVA